MNPGIKDNSSICHTEPVEVSYEVGLPFQAKPKTAQTTDNRQPKKIRQTRAWKSASSACQPSAT